MNRRDFVRTIPAVPGAFFLVGCPKVGTVIGDIQIAVDAVSIAAPIIAAFVPGAEIFIPWLMSATNGLQCVLSAASAPGATALLVSQAIADCIAKIVLPTIPGGTPQSIIDLINRVMTAIGNIVKLYGTPVAVRTARSAPPLRLNRADHSAVGDMRKKLDAALVVLVNKP